MLEDERHKIAQEFEDMKQAALDDEQGMLDSVEEQIESWQKQIAVTLAHMQSLRDAISEHHHENHVVRLEIIGELIYESGYLQYAAAKKQELVLWNRIDDIALKLESLNN